MFEAMFSILVPSENAPVFYKSFYHTYSLLQINDIIMHKLLERLKESDREELVNSVISNGHDFERSSIILKAMGVKNPSIEKRKGENRGLNITIFNDLKRLNIDSFSWYLQVNEFMNLYALGEQAIKEYLMKNKVDAATIKEITILNKLFDILGKKRNIFLKEIECSSSGRFSEQNEIINVWKYFTEIRNLYVHAGGKITDRFRKNMAKMKEKMGGEFEKLESKESMLTSMRTFSIDDFFIFDYDRQTIYQMEDKKMNFFRNYIIVLVESLYKFSEKTDVNED